MKRRIVGTSIASTMMLLVAAPAFAEGSRDTYISGWLPGVKSSQWTDNNKDNTSTAVTLSKCTYRSKSRAVRTVTLELHRNDTWTPDENYGQKSYKCSTNTSATQSWGDKGKGSFYFALDEVDGTEVAYDKLNVAKVKIEY